MKHAHASVRSNDSVFISEWRHLLNSFEHDSLRLFDVVGMDAFQEALKRSAELTLQNPVDAEEFIRPGHDVGSYVPLEAPNMRQSLRLPEDPLAPGETFTDCALFRYIERGADAPCYLISIGELLDEKRVPAALELIFGGLRFARHCSSVICDDGICGIVRSQHIKDGHPAFCYRSCRRNKTACYICEIQSEVCSPECPGHLPKYHADVPIPFDPPRLLCHA